jgi:hypothetical protein
VDPVPDPLFLRNLVAPGIEPGTSGSVAKNSDHYTTEAVENFLKIRLQFILLLRIKKCSS